MIRKIRVSQEAIQDANDREKYFEKFGETDETKNLLSQFFKVRFQLENQNLSHYVDENNPITFEEFKELINEATEKQRAAKQPKQAFVSQGKINKDKFIDLYGEEAYNQYMDLKRFLKSPFDDINYWFKVLKQVENLDEITAKRIVNGVKEELNEVLINAEERKELENARLELQTKEETEEDEKTREEIARRTAEESNKTEIVQGEGIEYLGGDSKYRVYKITSADGAYKFALPSREGRGWCITGGGSGWSEGGKPSLSKARNFWNMERRMAPFYFFITTPLVKSYAVTNQGEVWEAKNDSRIGMPTDLPLYLEGIPSNIKAKANVKAKLIDEFTIVGDVLTSVNDKSKTAYVVPSVVKEIGPNAFNGCSKAQYVTLQAPVKSIQRNAFKGCSKLTELNIMGTLSNIDFGAFENCSSLAFIDISSVNNIYDDTFKNCSKLQSVNVSKNLNYIGKNAFEGCISLKSIFIPSDCRIEDTSFNYCSNLTIFTNAMEKPIGWNNEALEKEINKNDKTTNF